jgi:hypothetical protein
MAALRYIIAGCGSHPGTGVLVFFVLMGVISGLQRGDWEAGLIGGGVMLAFFGPIYLYGAYDRAKSAARRARTALQAGEGK